jgi:hypothetical protein
VPALGGVVESPEEVEWEGWGEVGEVNVDESMFREVNFLNEPTPCSIREGFLPPASLPSPMLCVVSLEGVLIPLCAEVGAGTLVGRYPNLAVGFASGIILGSVMGDTFMWLHKC